MSLTKTLIAEQIDEVSRLFDQWAHGSPGFDEQETNALIEGLRKYKRITAETFAAVVRD